jgi:uncharacterized membrane protein (DUF106 family)
MGLIPTFTGLTTGTEIIILIIAVVYALGSVALQRKVSNAKKLRQTQSKVQKVSKELNEMVKNKASQEAIAAKQKEMMPLLSESMKSSIKPMFVILPLFLVVYYVLVPALPFASGNVKSVQGFFFIAVFVIGFIAAIILMINDRRITKKEEAMEAAMESADAAPPATLSKKYP